MTPAEIKTAALILIKETLESMNFVPMSYSGRGMYGKECLSVHAAPSEEASLLVELAVGITQWMADGGTKEHTIGGYAIEAIKRRRTDSMATDIVIYWPQLEWSE